jgi:hypothetical protein
VGINRGGEPGISSLPQKKKLKEGNIPNINRKKIFLNVSSMFEHRENNSNLNMKEMYKILIPRN